MATQSNLLPTNVEQNKIGTHCRASPTLWDYDSLASFQLSDSEYESCTRRVESLKEQICWMLMASTIDTIETIELINLLSRLGISYHFEREIEEQLNNIFDALPKILDDKDYDLYTTSILFGVFRQYGYKISSDVFKKFKANDGKFKEDITDDVRDVLGLYEASFFSVHGEDILDEAIAFTRPHLESLLEQISLSPHLAQRIRNALILPFHKGLPRVEARQFIAFYEKDESPNQILLEFARSDFNRLLLLNKQELSQIIRWWKESNLAEKLPYARDRIVECYFWASGIQFRPEYSLSRIMTAKYVKMISLCDDTYDAYATLDEIKAFTDAFERCNIDAMDQLPDYMKDLYKGLLDCFEETKNVSKERRPYCAYYAKEAFKELLRSYCLEAEWFNDGYMPMFYEYMHNGLVTSTYGLIPLACFIGMEEFARIKEFELLRTNKKFIKATKLIGRLLNDLVTHEEEQERGDCASGVECYMKEHNVSKEKAKAEILKMCENAWKDINEECMKPTAVSRPILEVLVNLTRVTEVFYRFDDGYTHQVSMKAKVTSLFIDPLPM